MSEPKPTSDGFHRSVTLPLVYLTLLIVALGFAGRSGYSQGQEFGTRIATESFQKDAIKQGVAQYDAVSGLWRWKTPDEWPVPLPVKDEPTVITNGLLREPSLFPDLPELPPEPIKPAPEKLPKRK